MASARAPAVSLSHEVFQFSKAPLLSSPVAGPLSDGTLEDDVVTCPWHGARFCVRDGHVQGPPAHEGVTSYPVRVTDGSIEIEC